MQVKGPWRKLYGICVSGNFSHLICQDSISIESSQRILSAHVTAKATLNCHSTCTALHADVSVLIFDALPLLGDSDIIQSDGVFVICDSICFLFSVGTPNSLEDNLCFLEILLLFLPCFESVFLSSLPNYAD